jgi:hypothetical protein
VLPWNAPVANVHPQCRRFSFLYKEHIPFEIQELKGQLRKSQDVADRRRLQIRLSKLQQALKKHEEQELADEVRNVSNIIARAVKPANRLVT